MRLSIAFALTLVCCGLAPGSVLIDFTSQAALAADGRSGASETTSDHRIVVANGVIDVHFASGAMRLSRGQLLAWVEHAARAVANYHGRFPVDHLLLVITPEKGRGVPSGTAYGYDGALIRLGVGRDSTMQELASDWVLVHEMVHLAFPSLAYRHRWLKEGLATYVEPITRFRAGLATRAEVWRWLLDGLPHGLPESGDQGLDYTPTWGRTYWGGALFCLLADIRIRERTSNRHGLRDALRAVNQAGGDITAYWPVERALRIADARVGVPVLTELYDQMKATPHGANLDELWRRLGVRASGGNIRFDDDAPLAHIRRGIIGLPATEAARG